MNVAWPFIARKPIPITIRPVGHGVFSRFVFARTDVTLSIYVVYTLKKRYNATHSVFGISQMRETIRYIEQQEEHHRTLTFQEEYLRILKRHEMAFDERYLWN